MILMIEHFRDGGTMQIERRGNLLYLYVSGGDNVTFDLTPIGAEKHPVVREIVPLSTSKVPFGSMQVHSRRPRIMNIMRAPEVVPDPPADPQIVRFSAPTGAFEVKAEARTKPLYCACGGLLKNQMERYTGACDTCLPRTETLE